MWIGRILGLIGPNGAGKTPLFDCLSRLSQPSEGEIRFEGVSVLATPRRRMADLNVGFRQSRLDLMLLSRRPERGGRDAEQ